MYDAWAAYDEKAAGTQLSGALRRPANERTVANKEKAISYAAYRALSDVLPADTEYVYKPLMKEFGYDPNNNSTDIETPEGIGNVGCAAVLEFRHHDKSNQLGDMLRSDKQGSSQVAGAAGSYGDWTSYTPVNAPGTVPARAIFVKPLNPDHWQPLTYTDSSGNLVVQMFHGAQWPFITPFAFAPVPEASAWQGLIEEKPVSTDSVHKLLEDGESAKLERIKQIVNENLTPTIRVLARDLTDEQALIVETTLIWQAKHLLTNKSSGKFISKFRPPRTLYKEIVGFDYHHRLWFFNVGEGRHRRWKDNVKYGYVGGGQRGVFRDAVEGLGRGDVIAAYVSGCGYVGVGKITGEARPAREFRLKDGTLLIDKPDVAPKIKENLDSLDDCEWMAPVKWVATIGGKDAYFEKKSGLFAPRSVRASLDEQPKTIEFIEDKFRIGDLFELTDADPSSREFSA
jgi:hypothetical protein